jgi:tRNA1Val (adenine37-N6)-methyltransferase
MRNKDFFDFKKFRISQSSSAMKVSSDACVFGALINVDHTSSILDIGAGTGILSLILAQKTNNSSTITALEIDDDSIIDATINIRCSPWQNRISLIHSSVQSFAEHSNQTFDLIISNPPFFQNSSKPISSSKHIARHSDHSLTFTDLISSSKLLSTQDTKFWFILPVEEMKYFTELAIMSGLFPFYQYTLQDYPTAKPKRIIKAFCLDDSTKCTQELFLYKEDVLGPYTEQFSKTMNPYYLFL